MCCPSDDRNLPIWHLLLKSLKVVFEFVSFLQRRKLNNLVYENLLFSYSSFSWVLEAFPSRAFQPDNNYPLNFHLFAVFHWSQTIQNITFITVWSFLSDSPILSINSFRISSTSVSSVCFTLSSWVSWLDKIWNLLKYRYQLNSADSTVYIQEDETQNQ